MDTIQTVLAVGLGFALCFSLMFLTGSMLSGPRLAKRRPPDYLKSFKVKRGP